MPRGTLSAAALSSSTSAALNDQDSELMLSFALRKLLAPGIGTVPCAMHQLMATCKGGCSQSQPCTSVTANVHIMYL